MDLDVGRHFLGGDNAVGFDEGRPLALVSNTRGKGNRMPVIELKKVEDGYYVGQIYGLDVEITRGRRVSPEMAPIIHGSCWRVGSRPDVSATLRFKFLWLI